MKSKIFNGELIVEPESDSDKITLERLLGENRMFAFYVSTAGFSSNDTGDRMAEHATLIPMNMEEFNKGRFHEEVHRVHRIASGETPPSDGDKSWKETV